MLYFEGYINDIFAGEFSLGIHSQHGQNENGSEFYEVVLGLFFFDVLVGKIITHE